jgi:predicted transcriptional regulator
MEYQKAAKIGTILAKDYAEDLFKLLVNYQDISASEAASRLNLHIRTAQDFLDSLAELEIVSKTEVFEKKRPYYRYSLAKKEITLEVDLSQYEKEHSAEGMEQLIRERKENGANFAVSRSGDAFNSVTIWIGDGREREEQKISLTTPQGQFLFHLPFPGSRPLSIGKIMDKAGLEEGYITEIQDIVEELIRLHVIESLD